MCDDTTSQSMGGVAVPPATINFPSDPGEKDSPAAIEIRTTIEESDRSNQNLCAIEKKRFIMPLF